MCRAMRPGNPWAHTDERAAVLSLVEVQSHGPASTPPVDHDVGPRFRTELFASVGLHG